jgi:hypothetical protein
LIVNGEGSIGTEIVPQLGFGFLFNF